MFPSELYLITDQHTFQEKPLVACVEQALKAGVSLLQYRGKNLPYSSRVSTAKQLKSLCEKFQSTLIVNDDLEIAVAVGANGVHLGQEDASPEKARNCLGSGAIIGVTVRNVAQAVKAEERGADYLGLGPIYQSSTKQPVNPLGLQIIRLVREQVKIPIFAIGGISLEKVKEVMEAGANGVAVISGILASPNIGERVRAFLNLLRSTERTRL